MTSEGDQQSEQRQADYAAERLSRIDPHLIKAVQLKHQGILKPPVTVDKWPVDYDAVHAWRKYKTSWLAGESNKNPTTSTYELEKWNSSIRRIDSAKKFYKMRLIEFVNHWLDTHDPRNAGMIGDKQNTRPVTMPLVLFRRQDEMLEFILECMTFEVPGLIEKSRDMGATWGCIGASVWMWLFWPGVTVGWGSATAVKLDRSGDASSIFEKIRLCIKGLPIWLRPRGLKYDKHLLDKRVFNPENGAAITGEVGAQIGRGGRTRVYFVDEAAYLEQPEEVEAALSETTRVRIDVSSVSGLGSVFHRTRQGGVEWEVGRELSREKTNVFVMDWRHHPGRDQKWHDERRAYWESKGMPHVFESEVERNYAAAVQGIVIPSRWLEACVDAHVKLAGFDTSGGNVAGLDVADTGDDSNALVRRKGWIIQHASQWAERDTALTTRRALKECSLFVPCSLQYDCIGVGAGIKAEANRLMDDNLFPRAIKLTAWNAGAQVIDPFGRVIPKDDQSPRNKDYYANLKAQGWWDLRQRVYRTFRAVTEGEQFGFDDLISICSKSIPKNTLVKLLEELSQATASTNTRMKLVVDKNPPGTRSPNLGDATVMCCFPIVTKPTMDAFSFAAPIQVSAGLNCKQCGSRRTHDLGRGRFQCHACGYIGEW